MIPEQAPAPPCDSRTIDSPSVGKPVGPSAPRPAADAPGGGTVYTETVIYSPPEAFINDVPYQLAIIELDAGRRLTGRILGNRVQIGDRVTFSEFRNNDVPCFRKTT